jgi:hypothetical protein
VTDRPYKSTQAVAKLGRRTERPRGTKVSKETRVMVRAQAGEIAWVFRRVVRIRKVFPCPKEPSLMRKSELQA